MDAAEKVLPDRWLAELELQIERVRDEGGATAVHQVRVAAGRLSVWLEIAGRRVLHDDLRWLRRSAAALRDIDVMLSHDPAPELEVALQAQRAVELGHLRRSLGSTRPRAILLGLRCVPAPDVETASRGVQRLARRALRAGTALSSDEREPARLHRVRRRVRRLRYALEWLNAEGDVARSIQDAFGAFNDCAVKLSYLAVHSELSAAGSNGQALADECEEARQAALDAWSAHVRRLNDLAHGDLRAEG